MTSTSSPSSRSDNPYESPLSASEVMPNGVTNSRLLQWVHRSGLTVFAVATLAGLFAWVRLQQSLPAPSVFDVLPKAPDEVSSVVVRILIFSTPTAILLLAPVWRRISIAEWVVIGPLALFSLWASMLPAQNLLRRHHWDSPASTWFLQAIAALSGLCMPVVTLCAVIGLVVKRRQIAPPLWLIILPALAFDIWFTWWWIELTHVL